MYVGPVNLCAIFLIKKFYESVHLQKSQPLKWIPLVVHLNDLIQLT